jgi:hypothetical protein
LGDLRLDVIDDSIDEGFLLTNILYAAQTGLLIHFLTFADTSVDSFPTRANVFCQAALMLDSTASQKVCAIHNRLTEQIFTQNQKASVALEDIHRTPERHIAQNNYLPAT